MEKGGGGACAGGNSVGKNGDLWLETFYKTLGLWYECVCKRGGVLYIY